MSAAASDRSRDPCDLERTVKLDRSGAKLDEVDSTPVEVDVVGGWRRRTNARVFFGHEGRRGREFESERRGQSAAALRAQSTHRNDNVRDVVDHPTLQSALAVVYTERLRPRRPRVAYFLLQAAQKRPFARHGTAEALGLPPAGRAVALLDVEEKLVRADDRTMKKAMMAVRTPTSETMIQPTERSAAARALPRGERRRRRRSRRAESLICRWC